jgi:hypothetical protein
MSRCDFWGKILQKPDVTWECLEFTSFNVASYVKACFISVYCLMGAVNDTWLTYDLKVT